MAPSPGVGGDATGPLAEIATALARFDPALREALLAHAAKVLRKKGHGGENRGAR